MSKRSAEQLVTLIIHKSNLISDLLDDISLKKFPSNNPKTLIKIISAICIALKEHTLNLYKDNPTLDSEDTENELKLIISVLFTMAPDIRFIEGASSQRIPWSLVKPFEVFSKTIPKHQDIDIILRPQWHYNFTIRRSLLKGYRESLKNILSKDIYAKIFDNTPREIYIISFPAIEKTNILLQSILGHELGHPFATDYLAGEDETKYLTEIRDDVETILDAKEPLQREAQRSLIIGIVKKIRNESLNEIISDLIAVHLFGFAVIFSAYELAIMTSLDDIPLRGYIYPPWRYRIRQMLGELNWVEYDRKMQEITTTGNNEEFKLIYKEVSKKMNGLEQVVSEHKDLENIEKERTHKIAYDAIGRALPNVKQYINEELRAYPQNPIINVFYLTNRLTHNLPPNALEIESPFNPEIPTIPDIINAGWFYKVAYLDQMSPEKHVEYLEKVDTLNHLIFKALELSDVSNKYTRERVNPV